MLGSKNHLLFDSGGTGQTDLLSTRWDEFEANMNHLSTSSWDLSRIV